VHHPSDRSATRAWRRSGDGRNGPSLPKGYDVLARAGWFPIVTGLQEVSIWSPASALPPLRPQLRRRLRRRLGGRRAPEGWTTADATRLQQQLPPE